MQLKQVHMTRDITESTVSELRDTARPVLLSHSNASGTKWAGQVRSFIPVTEKGGALLSVVHCFSDLTTSLWRALEFPRRKIRRRPPQTDVDAFVASCAELRRSAAEDKQHTPVSYALKADKRYYQDNTVLRTTWISLSSPPF